MITWDGKFLTVNGERKRISRREKNSLEAKLITIVLSNPGIRIQGIADALYGKAIPYEYRKDSSRQILQRTRKKLSRLFPGYDWLSCDRKHGTYRLLRNPETRLVDEAWHGPDSWGSAIPSPMDNYIYNDEHSIYL